MPVTFFNGSNYTVEFSRQAAGTGSGWTMSYSVLPTNPAATMMTRNEVRRAEGLPPIDGGGAVATSAPEPDRDWPDADPPDDGPQLGPSLVKAAKANDAIQSGPWKYGQRWGEWYCSQVYAEPTAGGYFQVWHAFSSTKPEYYVWHYERGRGSYGSRGIGEWEERTRPALTVGDALRAAEAAVVTSAPKDRYALSPRPALSARLGLLAVLLMAGYLAMRLIPAPYAAAGTALVVTIAAVRIFVNTVDGYCDYWRDRRQLLCRLKTGTA